MSEIGARRTGIGAAAEGAVRCIFAVFTAADDDGKGARSSETSAFAGERRGPGVAHAERVIPGPRLSPGNRIVSTYRPDFALFPPVDAVIWIASEVSRSGIANAILSRVRGAARSRKSRMAPTWPPITGSLIFSTTASTFCSNNRAARMVALLRAPFGRPAGLPDSPGPKRPHWLFPPVNSDILDRALRWRTTGHRTNISRTLRKYQFGTDFSNLARASSAARRGNHHPQQASVTSGRTHIRGLRVGGCKSAILPYDGLWEMRDVPKSCPLTRRTC